MRNILVPVAVMSAVALGAAGCGSSGTKGTTAVSGGSLHPETSSAVGTASTTGSVSRTGSTSKPTSAGMQVSSKPSKFGMVLAAGPKHLTVYRFEADTSSASHCYGACARIWTPVRTTGVPPTVGGLAIPRDLGTITRSDGTKQVTYYHQPLYYYVKDKDSSDAYGHGIKSFGATWYALRPGAATTPPLPSSTKP